MTSKLFLKNIKWLELFYIKMMNFNVFYEKSDKIYVIRVVKSKQR